MTDKRRPGRPEIGGRVTIALGDLLPRIDTARGRLSRAAWLRRAAEHYLNARSATPTEERR